MNIHEVGEIRLAYGLEHAPKIERRNRVVLAMNWMLCNPERFSLEDVREVVGGSASAWQRAQSWYREERGLRPGEPFIPGPLDRGVSDISTIRSPWEILAERAAAEQGARDVRILSGRHGGWSFLTKMARDGQRKRLVNVLGADVGDPVADWHYLRWRERREANRVQRQKAMADA